MKTRFSEKQIINILHQTETPDSAWAISGSTFHTWCKKFGVMEVPEVKRLSLIDGFWPRVTGTIA